MRVFADANVLVSVINKEYPLFPFTARILSLTDKKGFQLFTSPVCLAIAFYFAEKKHGTKSAKHRLAILSQHISIAENTISGVRNSFENNSIHDFEDGLEYYAAEENKCQCIITENKKDFYFSKIEVLGSMEFWKKYGTSLI